MPANSIFDSPMTNLLSVQCILIEILSHAHAEGAKKALMVSNLAILRFDFQVTAQQAWQ